MDGKHDLREVLEHYGVRVRSGTGWIKVCCPVHGERNASATVNVQAGRMRCHACGFSGDVYDLIGQMEGLGFKDAQQAADRIAHRSGGTLSAPDGNAVRRPSRREGDTTGGGTPLWTW